MDGATWLEIGTLIAVVGFTGGLFWLVISPTRARK